MSKRSVGGTTTKGRKRRRNGISTSSSVLDMVHPPPDNPQLMQVWHTHTADPTMSRKSGVPIPPEPQAEGASTTVEEIFDAIVPTVSAIPARPKRKQGNDSTKMETFLSRRPVVMDELLRHDGLQEHLTLPQCSNCLEELGPYRCIDCTTRKPHCASCIVFRHEDIPLHRLEVWNGGFFERTSLNDLGHCFYIGHEFTPCPSSDSTTQVIVIDMNGSHRVDVQFCACTGDAQWVDKYRQLLRTGWYPASFVQPKTAFTFDLLDTYHKLALQGKLNLYDFYSSMLQKTDNCGRKKAIHRYHEMSRCARQWRSLKQTKRGGGGHMEAGLSSVPDGAFALECPACPHPGRNLPGDWDEAPEDTQWLYRCFLAVDANFRLKLKNRGISDPETGSGWSYFVESKEYIKHITQNTVETEVASCGSDFHAVNQANRRSSKDYIASGVVACVCARHSLMQKNGVGDLQQGERYINTDYIIASVLKGLAVPNVVISYDIACKWSIHHLRRFSDNHPDLDVEGFQFSYLIPKFHLPAHGESCQTAYSFNYAKGVGRTHGETVEQGWANINLAALSTREMGPGARHSTLDDSWGGWNWKKILGMGEFLRQSLSKALLMREKHASENKTFDATFPVALREEWLTMIENWERNKRKPNPYTHKEKASNVAEVHQKLAEADEAALRRGDASHQVPGSVFIRSGLEIEEQQRLLAIVIKKKALKSATQLASTQEKRNTLMRQIKRWRELQLIYMPGVNTSPPCTNDDDDDDDDDDNTETAENVSLLLPSSLERGERERVCSQQVVEHERLLRMAQIQDSLIELRHTRKIRRKLLLNHHLQVAGQGQRANTRSRTVINSVESRIVKFVERYRAAYRALLQLDPTGNWQETYLELKESDNRGPGKEREESGVGDGSYLRSWIWSSNPRVPDTAADGDIAEEGASEEDVNEVLRVEWTTSFARLERWKEEVVLLQEEMRRVVMYLEWKSQDWLAKVTAPRGNSTPDIQSGLDAYARKQAAVYRNLAVSFAKLWHPTLVSHGLEDSWITDYMSKAGVPLAEPGVPPSNGQEVSDESQLPDGSHGTTHAVAAASFIAGVVSNEPLILEEADCSEDSALDSEDSGLEDNDSGLGDDFDDFGY